MTDLPVPPPPELPPVANRRQTLLLAVGGVLFALISVQLGLRLDRQEAHDEAHAQQTSSPAVTSDFGVFRHTGERFWRGEPIYRAGPRPAPVGERQDKGDGTMGFKYGPLLALILMPFAALPGWLAPAAWSFTSLWAALFSAVLLGRWIHRALWLPAPPGARPRPAPRWFGWVGLVAALFFIQLNLVYGQTNLVFLALLLYGLDLYSTGRPVIGGALAGLVAGMRLTPLVFLPYFLYKRQWRAGGGMLLGLVLAFALPALRWGPQEFTAQMQDWRTLIATDDSLNATAATAATATTAAPTTTGPNDAFYLHPVRYQSIEPMVLDTFALPYPGPDSAHAAPLQGYRNFLSGRLSHSQALLLAYALAGLIYLACAALCWRNYPPGDLRHLIEWSLVLTAMLLVSPYAERTHYVMLMPALTLLAASALSALHQTTDSRPLTAIVIAAGFIGFFNLLAPPFLPDSVYLWFNGFHAYVLGGLALFATLAGWLIRENHRPITPPIAPILTQPPPLSAPGVTP